MNSGPRRAREKKSARTLQVDSRRQVSKFAGLSRTQDEARFQTLLLKSLGKRMIGRLCHPRISYVIIDPAAAGTRKNSSDNVTATRT